MTENSAQSKGSPEAGHWLNFSPSPTDILHDFCGPHDIGGALCPNCNRPLMRLLSLFAKENRLGLDPVRQPVVHLLYCWTCSIPFGEFSYKVGSDGSVELLQVPPRQPEMEFGQEGPYDGYTGVFPHRKVSLQPLTPDEDRQLRARALDDFDDVEEDLLTPRHQVGGYPFIDNPGRVSCPVCSSEMPLLAAICDSAVGNDAFGINPEDSFTANGGVQMLFHFCRDCSIVSAYHSCD